MVASMVCSLSRNLLTDPVINNYLFKIKHHVSLASLSTFAIGGLAKNYIPVNNNTDLVKILNYFWQEKLPFKIFAGGSNIVFPDNGLSLFHIHLKAGQLHKTNSSIIAGAGVSLFRVIELAIVHGLSGLENLSGIPGSIGGAVVGNAGAYGSSISEVISQVKIWHEGKIIWLKKDNCQFSYRESIFKQKPYVILQIEMEFNKSDPRKLKKISDEIIDFRCQKYRQGLKCPGSFFKNIVAKNLPPRLLNNIGKDKINFGKIPAGYLLESVGAKGMRIGDIEIAPFHGNLFINKGKGTARDVKKLAVILKRKVYQKFGILLEEEIRYF